MITIKPKSDEFPKKNEKDYPKDHQHHHHLQINQCVREICKSVKFRL